MSTVDCFSKIFDTVQELIKGCNKTCEDADCIIDSKCCKTELHHTKNVSEKEKEKEHKSTQTVYVDPVGENEIKIKK